MDKFILFFVIVFLIVYEPDCASENILNNFKDSTLKTNFIYGLGISYIDHGVSGDEELLPGNVFLNICLLYSSFLELEAGIGYGEYWQRQYSNTLAKIGFNLIYKNISLSRFNYYAIDHKLIGQDGRYIKSVYGYLLGYSPSTINQIKLNFKLGIFFKNNYLGFGVINSETYFGIELGCKYSFAF